MDDIFNCACLNLRTPALYPLCITRQNLSDGFVLIRPKETSPSLLKSILHVLRITKNYISQAKTL